MTLHTMATMNTEHIRELIISLADIEGLQVPLKNMAIGAGIGLASVTAGMCVGGIWGLLAAAAVGGVGLVFVNGGVKPLSDYLKTLPPETQEKLYNGVKELLKSVFWSTVEVLIEKVLGDTKLKNQIVCFIKDFFEGSVKVRVVQIKKE